MARPPTTRTPSTCEGWHPQAAHRYSGPRRAPGVQGLGCDGPLSAPRLGEPPAAAARHPSDSLGRGYTLLGRGNLMDAEQQLREVLRDAEHLMDRRNQALAHQGLGVVLSTGGRPADAIPHTWRAFELLEDEPSRTRVLADLGVMLLTVGDTDGAECALTEVVRRGGAHEAVQ